jgi:hypothetical protein
MSSRITFTHHASSRSEMVSISLGIQRSSDLVFSCGVIEHFDSAEAVRLLIEQRRGARMVLTIVPATYALRNDPFAEASDARPMTLGRVKNLFVPATLEVVQTFGYGIPDDRFSTIYRYWLPRVPRWALSNKLSYACSVECFGRPRLEK